LAGAEERALIAEQAKNKAKNMGSLKFINRFTISDLRFTIEQLLEIQLIALKSKSKLISTTYVFSKGSVKVYC
jgi:hypothetical protein